MDDPSLIQHDTHSRPDIIKNLADHLQQYPQDIVDAKRLLRDFRASANEFNQALLVIDGEPNIIKNLVDYLHQYPQDIVDAKRLIKNFQASANQLNQALLVIDGEPVTEP